MLVVVEAPGFDLLPGILERDELMHVQALVAQAAVERLDVRVLHGVAGMDEGERHAAAIRPVLECAGRELGAMIHRDRARARRPMRTRSRASATPRPDIVVATSSNGLSRLH